MREHRALESLEFGPWVDAELFDQRTARVLIGAQGIGLPPGSIQREDELRVEALAHRMRAHETDQRRDDLGVCTARELRVDEAFVRGEGELVETRLGITRETEVA